MFFRGGGHPRALRGAVPAEADDHESGHGEEQTEEPGHRFDLQYRTGLLTFWGCAALVRRQVLERIGGYDPNIFVWANEVEFMLRFYEAGFRHLHMPEVRQALQDSEGLCLSHLRLVLGSVNEESVYETLLSIHRDNLERLKHELAEFIRKNDYQAIKEGFGSEGNAWLRAITMIVGNRKDR